MSFVKIGSCSIFLKVLRKDYCVDYSSDEYEIYLFDVLGNCVPFF